MVVDSTDMPANTEIKTRCSPERVASPCVSICLLNEDDICTGCYRSSREIRNWVMSADEERLAVLTRARQRSTHGNPFATD